MEDKNIKSTVPEENKNMASSENAEFSIVEKVATEQSEPRKSPHHSSHHSSHHRSSHSSHHSSNHSSHHSSSRSSSHSSSKSSSKHKKKNKKSKYEIYDKWRAVCSFLLFLTLAATAVCVGIRTSVLNETKISEIFTNNDYSYALYKDVSGYAKDLCLQSAIPEDTVEEATDYDRVSEVQSAYILGVFGLDEMYSESSYLDLIDSIENNIVAAIEKSAEENDYNVSQTELNNAAQTIAGDVAEYIQGKVVFQYYANLQSATNVSNTVMNILIVLFSVFSVAFLLLTVSLSDKRYRSMRSVAFSFLGAAGMNLFLVLFIVVISLFKELVIYPVYFCESVMRFINSCIYTFLFEALVLFLAGLFISALTWRLKRNNE